MSQTLLDQITTAVADEYTLLGQLGDSPRGTAFLARERAGGHLVVLAVPPSADELTVLAALGPEVPANGGTCTNCGYTPGAWTAHCPGCGRAFVEAPVGAHRYTADEVRAATEHAYDVLGEVAHQAGGSLFFVRDRVDGRLVALAARADASGEQGLEAVWDAARAIRSAADASPVISPGYPAYDAGATQGSALDAGGGYAGMYDSGYAGGVSGAPYAGTPGGVGAADPPGYPPGYVDPAAPASDESERPRRRWVPLAVAAALAVAAGGAWAAMRGDDQPAPITPTPPPDTAVAVGPPGPAGGQTTPTPVAPPDSQPAARTGGEVTPPPPPPPPPVDSAADSARRAPAVAFVQLEGALPAGWTWTINGRRGPSALTVRLRSGRSATLVFDAPGYCPETLQLEAPAPGSVQRWAPRLRGKPMVGECAP